MNELTIKTDVDVKQFQNKELQKATSEIAKISTTIRNNLSKIAVVLAKVDEAKLYEIDGFKSAQDYAIKVFGFKKSMAYTLVRVGKEYVKPNGETLLPHEQGKDFSVSQVEKLLPVGKDEAIRLVNEKIVTPDMTCKQIENAVKGEKPEETAEPVKPKAETWKTMVKGGEWVHDFKISPDAIVEVSQIPTLEGSERVKTRFADFKELCNYSLMVGHKTEAGLEIFAKSESVTEFITVTMVKQDD